LHGLAQQLVRSSDEERKRLASELHDTVLQELFYIKQGLHNDPTDPELQDYLEDVIQKLRQAIKDQRPPILDGGLAYALESLVHDMQKQVSSDTSITWVAI
jgi:signal transduction histidine kinase